MRNMILTNLAFGILGALLALLVGWPFGFAGGGFWWALWGCVAGLVIGFVIAQLLLADGAFSDHPVYTPQINCMIVMALLLLPGPLLAADRIAHQGDDWVRFTDKPCTSEQVRARLLPGEVDNWRAASAMFQKQMYQACYREVRGSAYLLYEDGDGGMVPTADIKEMPNV